MEHEYKVFVGVDWATEEHQVYAMDARRGVLGERVVKHNGAALGDLAGWLQTLGEPATVAVAIETPRGAVVELLLERGFPVFHLNPKQLDRFRDRHTVAGAKDDRRDAMVLADSLRTDTHLFHRIRPDDDEVILLRELVRADDDLAKEQNGLTNRLREQLIRYFPQVLELCSTANEPWVWDLLVAIPTPAAAAKASPKAVGTILAKNRIRRVDAEKVLTTLRQPPLRVAAGTIEAATAHIALLVPRLHLVELQRKAIEKRVKSLLEQMATEETPPGQEVEHRDVTVLLSLPGVGWKVSATMLVEASQALAERDYPALRALAGVAPITKQTGKNKKGKVEMRRAANNRLRNAAYHWARVATQVDPHARAHYSALRARGHSHGRALRSVADRNLRILMAMLRAHTLYDPGHPRRGQPDAAAA